VFSFLSRRCQIRIREGKYTVLVSLIRAHITSLHFEICASRSDSRDINMECREYRLSLGRQALPVRSVERACPPSQCWQALDILGSHLMRYKCDRASAIFRHEAIKLALAAILQQAGYHARLEIGHATNSGERLRAVIELLGTEYAHSIHTLCV
jgi:hypothetical protein